MGEGGREEDKGVKEGVAKIQYSIQCVLHTVQQKGSR